MFDISIENATVKTDYDIVLRSKLNDMPFKKRVQEQRNQAQKYRNCVAESFHLPSNIL